MTVFEAITEMRRISKTDGEFSFSFMTYSRDKRHSSGVRYVSRARLNKQSREGEKELSDYMLNYVDLDTGLYRNCYQPLLMTFNGNTLTL
jgi:hypothetical protein